MALQDELEVQEAIDAGDEALQHLDKALAVLRTAGRWGMADILGGGPIITWIKRSRMKEANDELEQARTALKAFSGELADLQIVMEFDSVGSQILTVADYLFDNPLTDLMVQSQIQETRRRTEEVAARVRAIQDDLVDLIRHIQNHS